MAHGGWARTPPPACATVSGVRVADLASGASVEEVARAHGIARLDVLASLACAARLVRMLG